MPGLLKYQLTDSEVHHTGVVFAPDGRSFAVHLVRFGAGGTGAFTESIIRVFETETGALRSSMAVPEGLHEPTYSADGRSIAVTGLKHFFLFDAGTGIITWNQPLNSLLGIKPSFAPDGSVLLSGTSRATVLFDAATGVRRWAVDHSGAGDDQLQGLALSPNGRRVAEALGAAHSPETGGQIRLLDAANGQPLWVLPRDEPVFEIRFSPDGSMLLAGSNKGIVTLVEAATGAVIGLLSHGDAPPNQTMSVEFSPDARLAARSVAGVMTVYDIESQAVRHVFRNTGSSSIPRVLQFTADSRFLLILTDRARVRLMSMATGAEQIDFVHGGDTGLGVGVQAAAISGDGRRVVTVGSPRVTKVFDAVSTEVCRFTHAAAVRAVQFAADGQTVVSGSDDATARTFDPITGAERSRITSAGPVLAVQWIPEHPWFAAVSADGSTRIVDPTTATERTRLTQEGPVLAVATNVDGSKLATGGGDGSARVIDVVTGTQRFRSQHEASVVAVAFSPDGTRLATASTDFTARLINTQTGAQILRITFDQAVRAVAFDPARPLLAAAGDDGTIRVVNTQSGIEEFRVTMASPVLAIAYNSAGTLLAGGSADGRVTVYRAGDGTARASLNHGGPVRAVVFSPDGATVATASDDHTARVLDPETGAEKARKSHDAAVSAVSYSPDGTRLATASEDGTARIWAQNTA
jgi:WD40 repeat protein